MGEVKGGDAGNTVATGIFHKQPLLLRQPLGRFVRMAVSVEAHIHAAVLGADVPPAAVLAEYQRHRPVPLADNAVDVVVAGFHLRQLLGQKAVVPLHNNRAGSIQAADNVHKLGDKGFENIPSVHPAHFVLDAPHDNGGVVFVPPHQPFHMAAAVLDIVGMVGLHGFAGAVDGGFVHDQHTHLIGDVQVVRRVRLRMKPHAVDARFLAHAVPGAHIGFRLLVGPLEVPGIPPQVHRNAIQNKVTALGPYLPEAKTHLLPVQHLPVRQQLQLQHVQERPVRAPQNRVRPIQREADQTRSVQQA
ncbi:hypothetical protein D3C75_636400 [compost metagenome]